MLDKNEILFPLNISSKHPYTKEIIELAEKADIGVSQIAEILKCTQPYVSQLKKGKGNAKVEALAPLISLLSPKLPGESFHTYTVLREAKPIIPDNWEQQVLVTGLTEVSTNSEYGRYPVGDDGFAQIEQNHLRALKHLDDNGKPVRHSNDLSPSISHSQDAENSLREALEAYETESKAQAERIAQCDKELEQHIAHALRYLPEEENRDKKIVEDVLRNSISRIFDRQIYTREPSSWNTGLLVDACRKAASVLKYPPLVKEFREYEPIELSESEWVHAPVEHANRLLEKLKNFRSILEDTIQKRRHKFRLQQLFKKNELSNLKELSISDPRKIPDWERYGDTLFGDCVRDVFQSANAQPYKVNMTRAFKQWARNLEFSINEEVVQICGKTFLSEALDDCKLVIYELPSEKFVYLYTFNCKLLGQEVTLLSEPLYPMALLEQIETEAKDTSWELKSTTLMNKLKEKLVTSGYRVNGIRSIY